MDQAIDRSLRIMRRSLRITVKSPDIAALRRQSELPCGGIPTVSTAAIVVAFYQIASGCGNFFELTRQFISWF
jgi:hypothetical protein